MRYLFSLFAVLLFCEISFAQQVTREVLGEHSGSEVCLFTLTNKDGNVLKLTNYGARIVCIEVPDKSGVRDNITTGGQTLQTIVRGDAYGGATIGRFANRIANGKFKLDDKEYQLAINNRPNSLHGGPTGFHARVWSSKIISDSSTPAVQFDYLSPDMEEGFPGTLKVTVIYNWTDKNEIVIDYKATTDKKTLINLTNHAYFNLHGTGKGYIFDHILTIKANKYTPLDANKIPTGQIAEVKGTPYDFTSAKMIGYKIGESFNNSTFQGYDDNYVLDSTAEVAAVVFSPVTGRVMEVITDQPGMQFYSGNGGAMWKRALDNGEKPTSSRSAFALETQHYPDSPNQSHFPSTLLAPGQEFKSRTIYRFSVRAGQN